MHYLFSPPNNQVRQILLSLPSNGWSGKWDDVSIFKQLARGKGWFHSTLAWVLSSPFSTSSVYQDPEHRRHLMNVASCSSERKGWLVGGFAKRSQTWEKGRGHIRHREQHEQRHWGGMVNQLYFLSIYYGLSSGKSILEIYKEIYPCYKREQKQHLWNTSER